MPTTKRTTVYRLQVGRKGVFRANVCEGADYDPPGPFSDSGLMAHLDRGSFWADEVRAMADKLGTTKPNLLFGFASKAQLNRWFPPQRQLELFTKGATLYAITLPATDVLVGHHQCVFKQSRFTRRKAINHEVAAA